MCKQVTNTVERMEELAKVIVEHYLSDLELDKEKVAGMEDGEPFLWMVRTSGTFIARLPQRKYSDAHNKELIDYVRALYETQAAGRYLTYVVSKNRKFTAVGLPALINLLRRLDDSFLYWKNLERLY